MIYYSFIFDGDYHLKEDGSHEILLIYVDLDGFEVAYALGDSVPYYGKEIDHETIAFVKSLLTF